MANKFHNGPNGPAICRAKTRPCRYSEENHYSTKEEAQIAYDRQMETSKDYIIGSHKITDSSIVTNMSFKDNVMEIEYSNGESVAYSSNKEEADEFLKSESKGRYLQNIKQNKIGLVKTGIISHENGIKDKSFIDSSFLSGSAHLDNHNYLVVDFKNGKRYLYNNINNETAHNFMIAENKGAYFSQYIKGNEVTSNNITLEESEIIHNNFGIDISKFESGEAISVDIPENSPKEYNQNESRVEFLKKNILNEDTEEELLKKEYPKLSYQQAKEIKEFLNNSNILDNEYFNIAIENDKVEMEDGFVKIPFKLREEEFTKEHLGVWGYGFDKNSAEVTNVQMTGEIYLDTDDKSVGFDYSSMDVNYDLVSGTNYRGLKSDVVFDTLEHQFISRIEDYSGYQILNYDL